MGLERRGWFTWRLRGACAHIVWATTLGFWQSRPACRAHESRQFVAGARRWTKSRNLEVRFVAPQGAGLHGTLRVGVRKTTIENRKEKSAGARQGACRPWGRHG